MSDPSPAAIYLDTSTVVTALFPGLAHGAASAAFCTAVAEQGGHAAFSQILWIEFTQALTNAARGTELSPQLRRRFRLARWSTNPEVRARWLENGLHELEVFLQAFAEVVEVPLRRSIWIASVDVVAQTQLRSHDAIHVATAREAGVADFVTVDAHFRRITDLRVHVIRDGAAG